MSNTLDISLKSVLDQIDDRFEVIVVDDGSTDTSLNILYRIKSYKQLRIIPLIRDRREIRRDKKYFNKSSKRKVCYFTY